MAEELQLALDLYPDVPDHRPRPGGPLITIPREHGEVVHAGGKGLVAIAHRTKKDRWRERVHGVEAALELLNHYRGQRDVYLSTQRFRGRRRVAYLLSLSELYADLDYYRIPELTDADPRKVLELALKALSRAARMPEPSLAISSGRGLYLLWLHEPIARSALPRWAACQRELCKVLKPLGADSLAVDAARVLRVIGTHHSEARAMVEAITPAGEVWEFNELADRILPLTRAELHDLRIQRALRGPRSPSESLRTPPEGFSLRRYPLGGPSERPAAPQKSCVGSGSRCPTSAIGGSSSLEWE